MKKIRLTTREAILEAAFECFGRNPSAPLEEVAQLAGVGRATLHRHFSGREDLMNALALVAMDELNAVIEEATQDATSYWDGMRLAMRAMVPLANRQWFLANESLAETPEVLAAYEKDQAELAETIEAAKEEGFLDSSLPTPWIVKVYENLIYSAWSMVQDGECTERQAADLAWRTFENGTKGEKR